MNPASSTTPTLVRNTSELREALEAGRPESVGPRASWTIELAGGEYPTTEPFKLFSGKHDGLTLRSADPSSTAQIHTLKPVSGWTATDWKGRVAWKVRLGGDFSPRQLFVGDRRRTPARWPKFDPDTTRGQVLTVRPYPEGQVPKLHAGTHRLPIDRADLPKNIEHLADAEVVLMHFWVAERLPDLRFAEETAELLSSRRTVYRLTEGTQPLPARYYLENLLDALSEPGEWCFLKSTRELFYLPEEGETPENTALSVTCQHRIFELEGQSSGRTKAWGGPSEDQKLSGLRFEDLAFGPCNFLQVQAKNLVVDREVPETDTPLASSVQAEMEVIPAVEMRHTEQITFERCTFQATGAHAIGIKAGCRDVTIQNCSFEDLGGGAIVAHGSDLDGTPAAYTRRVQVLNNRIARIGRIFHGSCGVAGGAVEEMTIAHNHISDTFYSGISLGWTWGYGDTICARHRVIGNRVEQISQGLLNDLGGIYFVGRNTGTVVRNNLVRDVRAANFGARGIYLDEGCLHFLVEQNVVDTVGESCLNLHYGKGHLIRHNLFARSESGISLSRDDGEATYTALQNLFWETQFPYWGGYAMSNLAETTIHADLNWIFPQTEDAFQLHHPGYLGHPRVPLQDWQASGNDRNATFADPQVEESAEGFLFPSKTSPALQAGFPFWDLSETGPHPKLPLLHSQKRGTQRDEF